MAEDRLIRKAALLLAAAAASLLTGCGGGAGAEKAGGSSAPVVLRMADAYADLNFEPEVAYIVTRVGQRSRGALRLEVVNDWATKGNVEQPDFEQQIGRRPCSSTAMRSSEA